MPGTCRAVPVRDGQVWITLHWYTRLSYDRHQQLWPGNVARHRRPTGQAALRPWICPAEKEPTAKYDGENGLSIWCRTKLRHGASRLTLQDRRDPARPHRKRARARFAVRIVINTLPADDMRAVRVRVRKTDVEIINFRRRAMGDSTGDEGAKKDVSSLSSS